MTRPALLALAALLVVSSSQAEPPSSRRKVAVLEFRAGTEGARNLALRAATVLRTATSLVITDPDDARGTAGPRIDREIAGCAGKPACISAVGERLGVDEVLLVGVAEFGDLIVTLQRVDVASKQVLSRVADSLAKGTEPDPVMVEGYLKHLLPPEDFLRYGMIAVLANVDGAVVSIGGTNRGMTPLAPVTVPAPSTQDVRVSKPGYVDFLAQLQVSPDGTVKLRPTLIRRYNQVWYKKWWVWAVIGGVATGAAVAGMALSQPAPTAVPVVLEWR